MSTSLDPHQDKILLYFGGLENAVSDFQLRSVFFFWRGNRLATTPAQGRMRHSSGLPYNQSNSDLEIGLTELPVERVNRWTQAKLCLNALYRFRHTLVLKSAEKKQAERKLRTLTEVIRAAIKLKDAADHVKGTGESFPIEPDALASLMRNSDLDALQQYGGKEGLADLVKTDLDRGICGDDLPKRRIKFGANVYPTKPAMSHWKCLWEAPYDFTRIVLVIAFVGSVVMGIVEETKILGWHDVFSVAIAAAMFIFIAVLSDYNQARLQHMIIKQKETRNINSLKSLVMSVLWKALNEEIVDLVEVCDTAQAIWQTLENLYTNDSDFIQVHELMCTALAIQQDGQPVAQYFTKLKNVWAEIDMKRPCMIKNQEDIVWYQRENELERVHHFLKGLDA
ncbi:calcium-transporting ATPase 10, plasma membrane-type-like [Argentina anserina]|uniref:calcium-transporting ATPase 10, plasma membrane-type-like n=1 Tax=Argentina anserina TaxID=57926 RepID=UPI0021765136|nr:calcium-transporting ATPase 10, plasma membrane-type-like [Potentilla anserina]